MIRRLTLLVALLCLLMALRGAWWMASTDLSSQTLAGACWWLLGAAVAWTGYGWLCQVKKERTA